MARPTKLTPEVQEIIVSALKLGASKKKACQYAGITEKSFYEWLQRAERDEQPYREFSEQIEKAEADHYVRALAQIETAARSGTWQASAWKLERKYPEEWGRTIQEQKVTGHVVHAHAWVERLQKGHDELDAKRVKQLPPSNGAHNGSSTDRTTE
jgi:transposase